MEQAREIVLASGAKLRLQVAPYEVADDLAAVIAEEFKPLKIDPNEELNLNLWKNGFLAVVASKNIRAALKPCLDRCLYNGERISPQTWEPLKAREDAWEVFYLVAFENIRPFMNRLFVKLPQLFKTFASGPA